MNWKQERKYKSKQVYRARRMPDGSYEVKEDREDSAVFTFTNEEFHSNFEMTAQSLFNRGTAKDPSYEYE